MPRPARSLLASLGCHLCQGLVLDDASVLAQSTFLLRKLQDKQAPYYPLPPLQQGPPPQQTPFYPQGVPQLIPQQPQGVPQLIPQQPQPYFPSMPGYMPMPPQQQPYYPGQQPMPMPYYPGASPQAPYYPAQPPPMPYIPGQPQYQPTQPLQAPPPEPRHTPLTPPAQVPTQPPQAPAQPQQAPPPAAPETPRHRWFTTPEPIIPTTHDTVEIKRIKRTTWEKHPKIYDIYHAVPNTRLHCIQGTYNYMLVALERLKLSPVASQWGNVSLEVGSCTEATFLKGPDYHRCFPQAVLYHPYEMSQNKVSLHQLSQSMLGTEEARRVTVKKAWKDHLLGMDTESLGQEEEALLGLCDNGRMMEETFGMPVAAPSFALKPASGRYCVQGSKHYLRNVLRQLNETAEFRDAEVEEGACLLHNFRDGPRETRCLPHASLYLNNQEVNETEERLAGADEDLGFVCSNSTLVSNVTVFLRSRQERADLRERRLREDAEEEAMSNFYMFDEKLYACWQGSQKRLEKIRDYFRGYGMPEWFFQQRLKIYSGGCDSMCMLNGWVERRSCIRHMRQCRHPRIEDVDPFLKRKESLVTILTNSNLSRVEEMIDGSDLESSCGPVARKNKTKGHGIWDLIQKEIDMALKWSPVSGEAPPDIFKPEMLASLR